MFSMLKGNFLIIVTNPLPSEQDPAHFIKTAVSYFRVLDQGSEGAYVVPCRTPVEQFPDLATNEKELYALYEKKAK